MAIPFPLSSRKESSIHVSSLFPQRVVHLLSISLPGRDLFLWGALDLFSVGLYLPLEQAYPSLGVDGDTGGFVALVEGWEDPCSVDRVPFEFGMGSAIRCFGIEPFLRFTYIHSITLQVNLHLYIALKHRGKLHTYSYSTEVELSSPRIHYTLAESPASIHNQILTGAAP